MARRHELGLHDRFLDILVIEQIAEIAVDGDPDNTGLQKSIPYGLTVVSTVAMKGRVLETRPVLLSSER